jgi:hypothetical protein
MGANAWLTILAGTLTFSGTSDLPLRVLLFNLLSLSLSLIWVRFLRMETYSAASRAPPSFPRLLSLYLSRSLKQQRAAWRGFVFDLVLVVVVAAALGASFGASPGYELSPGQKAILNGQIPLTPSGHVDCPDFLKNFTGGGEGGGGGGEGEGEGGGGYCDILLAPKSDPILLVSTMTVMSTALAGVSSSIRVFGAEAAAWRLEKAAGASTGAYCLGKMIAHIPTLIAAPALFVALQRLTLSHTLVGAILPHFAIVSLLYAAFSGLGYLISVVVRPDLAYLVGVLTTLVSLLLSGSGPMLPQMSPAMYAASFASPLRYAQEAFYLLQVEGLGREVPPETAEVLYGYVDSFLPLCWSALLTVLFLSRVFAFLVMRLKA